MPSITPQLTDNYSSLRALTKRAIRRFGDFSSASINGDVDNMFIEFANMVVDDYQQHPYFDGREGVTYYTSADDIKPIEDNIMLSGLLAHYAFQQMSEKTPGYQTLYYRTMNQLMWQALNGNTAINMRPTDGGSNKQHSILTNTKNGLPLTEEEYLNGE